VANHKDALKRHKQSLTRRLHNRAYRTRMRNQVKKVREAIGSGDTDAAQTELRAVTSVLHRVAGKGIIHRNQAARKLSRLTAAVKAMSA